MSNILAYPRSKPWPKLHSFSSSLIVTLIFCFYPEGANKKPLVMSLIPRCVFNCNRSLVLPEINRHIRRNILVDFIVVLLDSSLKLSPSSQLQETLHGWFLAKKERAAQLAAEQRKWLTLCISVLLHRCSVLVVELDGYHGKTTDFLPMFFNCSHMWPS